MRRIGRGWDLSFFWQFVKSAHSTVDWLKKVVLLVTPSVFDAFVPWLLAALSAAFFVASGRPKPGAIITTSSDGSPAPPSESLDKGINPPHQ